MSNKKQQEENKFNYALHGKANCNTDQVRKFIQHMIKSNERTREKGNTPKPLCIWGKHGIGKTQLVEQIAKENGYKFTYIAPAQFEEMGDLLGMPKVNDEGETAFARPDWVPTEECNGILLIDDVNRADDRILRGCMQLLQNFELISWKLPKGWQIVLTANPEGGDYSVTPMDHAMLTRMMHISMTFDEKEWAKWAELNNVDGRVINWVLKYPEQVDGEMVTPRSIVNFAESIELIENIKQERALVDMLLKSAFDNSPACLTFLEFVDNNLGDIISPDELINDDFKNVEKQLTSLINPVKNASIRTDIASLITTRTTNYLYKLKDDNYEFTDTNIENILSFISIPWMPSDLMTTFVLDIQKMNDKNLGKIIRDKRIGKLI